MIEPERGFAIDDTEYRWGTLLSDIAGMGALPTEIDYLHRAMPCSSAFSFSTAGVLLSAPAPDRPILRVTYGLAAPLILRAWVAAWLASTQKRFGPAEIIRHQDVSALPDPSSGVRCWANWHRPTVSIHLSIYGGVRGQKSDRSLGALSVAWSDTEAAASPFVAAWRAATAALAEAAQSVRTLRRFDLPEALDGPTSDADALAASRALFRRTLLATPPSIGERLNRQSFALWQSALNDRWALSTLWDTTLLGDALVTWFEMHPAKGGGHSALAVDHWSVTMPYGTPAIVAAAAALNTLPGVTVEKFEDYDT